MGFQRFDLAWQPSSDRAVRWTHDGVIEAVHRWVTLHGEPPRQPDWKGTRGSEWPSSTHVARLFGTWAGAIRAAGYELPRRRRRRGSVEERFWATVTVDVTGCWEWPGSDRNGYGVMYDPTRPTPRVGAHRYAYELLVGPIPKGHDIDHLCRNRACVNPLHLEPVTRKENVLRGARSNQR